MIRWGIIGLGKIAGKFCLDLKLVEGTKLFAVASRSQEKADAFASEHGASKAYGSYDQLIHDSDVDVVYVATPHVHHAEISIACLKAGKGVLCEKPFAMNTSQVQEMIMTASQNKVFLMEALWTRFFPSTQYVLELCSSGQIGNVRMVQADFGFSAEYDTTKRLFNKGLGGGALLDIGIYPVYLSYLLLGYPQLINAQAHIGETGVDHSIAMMFKYPGDTHAILSSTLTANTQTAAWIYGSEGAIQMHSRFHHCEKVSIYKGQELIETLDFSYSGGGYQFEIEEVVACMREGRTESKRMSYKNSQDLINLLDQVREAVSLSY
jgi:predicted dehydrogenase